MNATLKGRKLEFGFSVNVWLTQIHHVWHLTKQRADIDHRVH